MEPAVPAWEHHRFGAIYRKVPACNELGGSGALGRSLP